MAIRHAKINFQSNKINFFTNKVVLVKIKKNNTPNHSELLERNFYRWKCCGIFGNLFSISANNAVNNHFGQMALPYTTVDDITKICKFNSNSVLEQDVINASKAMKNKRVLGVDELALKTICNIIDIITKSYTYLLNQPLIQ